jgi:hypothetical protein
MEVKNMALRLSAYLIEGELDNTRLGQVTEWMQVAGMKEKMTLALKGDFHRDIRGAKIHFTGDASAADPPEDAAAYLDGLAVQQTGKVGDNTPPTILQNIPYSWR